MMNHRIALTLTLAVTLASACGETGQREIRYPIFAGGTAASVRAVTVGEWSVTLDVARIGFGPVYFCATEGASSSLCPAAVAELADSVEVDLLATATTPARIGDIYGVTGSIRSATYDYAYVWLKTQSSPAPTAAAPAGHSARFEGRATRGSTTFRFSADIDIVPTLRGTRSVQGARVTADVADEHQRLDVRFDAAAWLAQIPFDVLAAQASGDTPVVITRGTTAYNALTIGMTAIAPPTFTWSAQ